jgi:hypothetical protein
MGSKRRIKGLIVAPAREAPPKRRWTIPRALRLPGLVILVAVGLLLAGRVAAGLATQWMANASELRLPLEQVQATPQPEWIHPQLVPSLLHRWSRDGKTIGLAQPDLVRQVGEALERSPWVQRVRVEKSARSLQIHLDYRRPVLFIPWGEGTEGCYVDETGVVLPAEQASRESLRSCLIAEGLSLQELPKIGSQLKSRLAKDVCRLAGFLHSVKSRLDLVAIIASAPDQPLVVRTRRGSKILWGLPSDRSQDDAKLHELLSYQNHRGGLDQPNGPYQFDLPAMLAKSETRRSLPMPPTEAR